MKKIQNPFHVPEFLKDVHIILSNLPFTFRDRICKQCNWSVPTFYRKMRLIRERKDGDDVTLPPIVSKAEKEMIIMIMDNLIKETSDYTKKYANGR